MPFFSIIVPIYNKEQCLEKFIRNFKKQTFTDYELILVDDGSTDSSLDIMKRYSESDSRIKVVKSNQNSGIYMARRNGFENSSGKYIWNIDPDDSLSSDSVLEKAHKYLNDHEVEVFEFGFFLNFDDSFTQEIRDEITENLLVYNGAIDGENIVHTLLKEGKFRNNVWNKIIMRDSLFNIYEGIDDKSWIVMAEDMLISFPLLCCVRSYYGCNSFKPYIYEYGAGVSNQGELAPSKIESLAAQSKIIGIWKDFFLNKGIDISQYSDYIDQFEEELIANCLNLWFAFTGPQSEMLLHRFIDAWTFDKVFMYIAAFYKHREKEAIERTFELFYEKRVDNIRTIGIYDPRLNHKETKKDLDYIVASIKKSGYDVVLLTDDNTVDNACDFSEDIKIIKLENVENDWYENIKKREKNLRKAISEYNIDVLVYMDICSRALYWDMRTVQGSGAYFIIHSNTCLEKIFQTLSWDAQSVLRSVMAADAIASESIDDYKVWCQFNDNTAVINSDKGAYVYEKNDDKADKTIISTWKELIDCLSNLHSKNYSSTGYLIFRILDLVNEDVNQLRKELDEANAVCGDVITSASFKIGRCITSFPRNVRDFFIKTKGEK